ncbi:AAA family ATPase [Marinomonas primoryensis]|uniref:AAA family ATPase n=1 Tax=Marinomonas primoryensis TaxID=178399 RepID=A0A2Z4PXL4_9GAMM|nr:ATP-binding protein [Marinomonas primoryensis]AWY02135.1 AAA family ATPase [Marinomonas primoryensis]
MKVTAIYKKTGISSYDGNPLIEALPPIADTNVGVKALRSNIVFDDQDLTADRPIRAHNICRIMDEYFQPLSAHARLNERIDAMIRLGYVARNPANGGLQKHLQNGYERLQTGNLDSFRFEDAKSSAQSTTLIGCSGGGKTTALRRILSSYPQVIYHPDRNLDQVVYLKIDCSHDGSLKEICLNFFRALDRLLGTDYEDKYGLKKRNGTETLLAIMAQIANAHTIGLLVIDEIQHLSKSRSGGSEKMLNFFVTLVNTIGLPVLLIGTPKAREIFELDLRSARRSAGFGAFYWETMPKFDKKGAPNLEWHGFTDSLWKLQLLQDKELSLTDDVRDTWYDLSQGVMDIVVKLFVLSQLRALAIGKERITSGLLRSVYETELKPVHPMLAALRSGKAEKIAQFSDLIVPELDKRLINLRAEIVNSNIETEQDKAFKVLATEGERRVFMALKGDFSPDLLVTTIKKIFKDDPTATFVSVLPVIMPLLTATSVSQQQEAERPTKRVGVKRVKKCWDQLPYEDVRSLRPSAKATADDVFQGLEKRSLILNIEALVA